MKILITGVHGFVGTNLVKALAKEHEIYGLDIMSPKREGVIKTFFWRDLEVNGLPSVDAIIHLAGKAHDTKNQAEAEEYFAVNTELTKKVYDYFLQSETKKFIFFSSVKAAADRVEGDFVDENVEPAPKGPYGESKIAAERYILSKSPAEIKENAENNSHTESTENTERALQAKKVYILRPCMIHGPGNKGNLNLLYGVVKKGIPWPLGAFKNKRTFTSIDNVSFIIKGLLTKNVESGIYNINDDEAVSTNELIEIICQTLDKKAHIWRIPRGLMNGAAWIGGLLHLPLNPERLQKLTENYISSNAKIKAALGIDQLPIRAKDGLYKTIRAFES
jgi:nucleoside-diphosphate-sugar epimerase